MSSIKVTGSVYPADGGMDLGWKESGGSTCPLGPETRLVSLSEVTEL